ncbi:glycosyltransferase family 2 protein [Cohnella terricola]|uniref:Glycosyltransferase family 2 protein n=1 Tax=Cohnella terricola TaxID=1289167 RepID=A0A559JB02_9BACL|nr:glycosyltransferase family 2 protein [Cohnella terricola]TVX97059.1 glycosyltransferase family 2 protein [Cohnella terricola]
MSRLLKQPLVSVCIVTYNSANYIRACLQGIKLQSWPNLKIIVVDNASSDNTVEIIDSIDLNVRIIANRDNMGFAGGQNQAISSSSSDYVLVLNPDVVLDPDYVKKLVERLELDSLLGSTTGCLTLADNPKLIDSTGLEMNWTRKAVERGADQALDNYCEACQVFGVSGAAAMYSRKMINEISIEGQLFDEDFFAYKEDVDVAWRAGLLGWKAWYEPTAKGSHVRQWRVNSDRKQIALKIRRHSYQNRYLMILKNERFNFRWWLRFPLLVAYEIALNGYFLTRDPKVLGVSWLNLFRLLPSAWRKRKLVQSRKIQH